MAHAMRIAGFLSFALVIILFQNCNSIGFGSARSRVLLSGGGFDGARYLSYASCNGKVDVNSVIEIASDFRSAKLIEANCQNLPTSSEISMSDLAFGFQNSAVFIYQGQIFDEQLGPETTAITQAFCSGFVNSMSAQVLIWSMSGTANLMGEVILSNGTGTGVLSLTESNQYYTSIGVASSNMTANLSVPSASFTAPATGTSQLTNMVCQSQPLPAASPWPNPTSSPTPSPTPTWDLGPWSACSAVCGAGQQTRSVACLDTSGNVTSPGLCGTPFPASSQACNTQPCVSAVTCAMTNGVGYSVNVSGGTPAILLGILTSAQCQLWCQEQDSGYCTWDNSSNLGLCQSLPAGTVVSSYSGPMGGLAGGTCQ